MSTGSIQSPQKTLSPYSEKWALPLTLLNGSAGDLLAGQEVYVSADNAVSPRTLGTQFPIGTVKVPAKVGQNVTVETVFNRDMQGYAKGGTLATGDLVRHDGTTAADGLPNFVASASGNYVMAVVLDGGTVGTVIRLGILRNPIKI